MKIKKKKFVVGALLSTCSLAIVSSITSTFAWYSYNTKNGMAFTGVATGDTEFLQVRLSGEDDTKWRTTLTPEEVSAYSKSKGFSEGDLAPVTLAEGIGRKGNDAELKEAAKHYGFYGSPSYLIPKSTQTNIKDSSGNYVFYRTSFQFRVTNPAKDDAFLAKKIYISFMDTKVTSAGQDVTTALRMHINQGTSNYMIAPGYADNKDFDVTGKLNLIGDETEGAVDKGIRTSGDQGKVNATYRPYIKGLDDPDDVEEVIYGNVDEAKELCFGKTKTVSTFADGKLSSAGIVVGETQADGTPITVNLTVWLDGWDPAVVNSNINATFAFGIQFEIETLA